METFLEQLLVSLNLIEVKGKENMDYLLGSIMAVERALKQVREQKHEGGEDNG